MSHKSNQIEEIDVYLQKRKTREYVGRLSREKNKFIFTYKDTYLYKPKAIPVGPEFPLTKQKFSSNTLFPTFEDRIPSTQNPAYDEYCKMAGIEPSEKDPLVLISTIGQKGPSSFIFSPVITSEFNNDDVLKFRKDLKLTVREFSDLFDFSPATINRIEKKSISGKDALKRLEIYCTFPEVALNDAKKNKFKIHEKKIKYVEKFLKSKCKQKKGIIKIEPSKRKIETEVFIQEGYLFYRAAIYLFSESERSKPLFMKSWAVLAHLGIEQIMKACWIWDKNEYSKTHDLSYIANQISFLNAPKTIQNIITKIDTFYYHRYPIGKNERNKIQKDLNRIEDSKFGLPTIAGEIATYEWEAVDELYEYIIGKMPKDLLSLWKKTTNQFIGYC